jgi:hypothetical protein
MDPPEGSQVNEGSTVTVFAFGALIPQMDLKGMTPAQIDAVIKSLHWP